MPAVEIVEQLIMLAVKLVGYEVAQQVLLNQKQIDEANAVADTLEDAKFGPR